MNYKYVSIDRIFSKLIRDYDEIGGEGNVVEWCGEALEFIGAVKHYEEAVAYIEVKNHQCVLPVWLHAIVQVARDNAWCKVKEACTVPADVIKAVGKPYCKSQLCWSEEDSEYVLLDCNGTPIYDYELGYYRPYFDLKWEYELWRGSTIYHRYSPVRLSNNTFFDSLVCTDKNQSLYHSCKDEYTVIRNEILRFSFKEGMVAVAYLRQVVDQVTGYPLIPDNISYTTAITKYIALMRANKDFDKGRAGARERVEKYEADWHWYCKQAGNVDMMPYGVDDHQDLLDQRSYILPRQNRYYGFFGKLNNPEMRPWNNSNGLNSSRFVVHNNI